MTINPVYSREMKVSSRSIRLPLIIAGFNLILAVFALFSMAGTIGEARQSAQINYATFLVIFRYVAIIEFALVLFIMPSFTSGSISGEREHRTLDLMLTTKLTPLKIVLGKLESTLSTIGMVIVSSLPIFALAFAYGGVTIIDVALLLLAYAVTAVFAASLGIWASSISSRSAMATAITYGLLLVFAGGTAGILLLVQTFSGNAGGAVYILLANPVVTFYTFISSITGVRNPVADIAGLLKVPAPEMSPIAWFITGMVIEAVLSVVLLAFAVRQIRPGKNSRV